MEENEEWRRQRKIAHLPGTRLDPKTVLARSIEKSARMKGVLIGILWDDDTADIDWSCLSKSQFSWVVMNLLRVALRETTDHETIVG